MKNTGIPTPRLRPALLAPLGHQLRNLRQAAGLTQSELARRTNRSAATICRYETGTTDLSVGTLWYLASAMGCELQISLIPDH